MLVSLRHPNYSYIGTTSCIRTRIQMHNSGNGARATAPAYLRPFALFAYICGFTNTRTDLRYYVENQWKQRRDYLISLGNNDKKVGLMKETMSLTIFVTTMIALVFIHKI